MVDRSSRVEQIPCRLHSSADSACAGEQRRDPSAKPRPGPSFCALQPAESGTEKRDGLNPANGPILFLIDGLGYLSEKI